MDEEWWRLRHEEKLKELRARRVDLLFLGDSFIQNYERSDLYERRNFAPVWQHFYGDRNAVNLGYDADTTANLLWRVENGEAAGVTPKEAVVLIATNNIDWRRH
jgi:hypothetical protein